MESVIQQLFQDEDTFILINNNEEYDKVTDKIQKYCDKKGIKVTWCSGTSIKRQVFGDIKNKSKVIIHITRDFTTRYNFSYVYCSSKEEIEEFNWQPLFTATQILTGTKSIDVLKCFDCINSKICYNSPIQDIGE